MFSAAGTLLTNYISDTISTIQWQESNNSQTPYWIALIAVDLALAGATIFTAKKSCDSAKLKASYGTPQEHAAFFTRYAVIMTALQLAGGLFVLLGNISQLYAPYDEINDVVYIGFAEKNDQLMTQLAQQRTEMIIMFAVELIIFTAGYIIGAVVLTKTFGDSERTQIYEN